MTWRALTASGAPVVSGHYIDGKWREPLSPEVVEIIEPATGAIFGTVPRATVAEAEQAVRAARAAFDSGPWPRLSGRERARILHGLADALWRHREELAETVVRQGGCTISQARGLQVYQPIELLRGYADLAAGNPVESVDISREASPGGDGRVGHTVVIREPAGVVAAITPFNYPFFLSIQKVGPALAAGCTVVLKPTEYTCLDAALLARIVDEETEIPPGVLNVLLGAHGDVGELLSAHPMVDQVTFTGSTQTGRRIMAAAAATIKRVTLELGGKNANIIFADADLDRALAGDCGLVVRHAGQGCGALSRVLVQRPVHDEVVRRMRARAATVVVGDPMDPATEMGPLVSAAQWQRVKAFIDSGVQAGARLVAGGARPAGLPDGFFMSPTIVTDVTSPMAIVQEEIFGPVVVVQPFDTEPEAVALANDTIYGLVGSVWSGTLDRALRVASALRAGLVYANGQGSADPVSPYGGYKQSGLGREWGRWGYLEYTEIKTLRYSALGSACQVWQALTTREGDPSGRGDGARARPLPRG
jgi:aldehyde dehydrogenase (NAD+)